MTLFGLLSTSQSLFWLSILVLCIVIEIATMGLTTIWFAGGALVAAILAMLSVPFPVQVVSFILVSFILLLFTRPVAVKYFNKDRVRTNVESLIGQEAIVVSEIDNLEQAGRVTLQGEERSENSGGQRCDREIDRWRKTNCRGKKRGLKMGTLITALVLLVIVIWVLASCIKIVPQAQAYVVERLGAYQGTWSVGLHFKTPFIDKIAKKVVLKEQVVDFAPQPVITKDNVTMRIDTVVFYQITDPKLFAYGVENPIMAIENLTATTLRNIIGDMELDQTLTSREIINTKMSTTLDIATDPWGIKVNRVELKNIIPPAAIQDAMEKQMKAERERRESILRAEGEKKSTILVAEGKKESAILEAEAEKQSAILRAEAQKEKMIREAEGEAAAILKVQQANADGIRMVREAGADEKVLQIKSLEALEKVAEGESTKIIIPSDLQGVASLATTFKEVISK